MSYMRSTDSAVLQEFGRIMQEKDQLKKVAQTTAAPLSDDEKAKLQQALAGFAKMPSNGPGMERWINRLKGQTDPYLKQVHDALVQRHQLWQAGKGSDEVAKVPLPAAPPAKVAQVKAPPVNQAVEAYTSKLRELQARATTPNPNHDPKLMISRRELAHLAQLGRAVSPQVAQQANGPLLEYDAGRDPKPVLLGLKTHEEAAAVPHNNRAALSIREKVAEQKAYDVTGKEDIVHEAHPQTAKVNGDVVENLNEQQDADLAVAEKSAKSILIALYKLAKRLKAEKNAKAYTLVKETFLELSKSLRK